MEWKRLQSKRNEPPPNTPKASLQEGNEHMTKLERYPLLRAPSRKPINFNKYGSHLNELKAALFKMHLKLVNRKCIIFHQDNARLYISLIPYKNDYSLVQKL